MIYQEKNPYKQIYVQDDHFLLKYKGKISRVQFSDLTGEHFCTIVHELKENHLPDIFS